MSHITIDNHGSIWILTPTCRKATAWCQDHIDQDGPRWGVHGYAIEPRYVGPIIDGAIAAGFSITINEVTTS